MEISKTEVKLVAQVESETAQQGLVQLAESQLALVGGGVGEVVVG